MEVFQGNGQLSVWASAEVRGCFKSLEQEDEVRQSTGYFVDKHELFVKSTSPTTENWLRKLCTYSMNINMSDEDKHDTNYINKHKDTDIDTRELHNL